VKHKPKANWYLDALLFGGLLLVLSLDLTGRTVHQWLGLAVGTLALYHLAVHGSWVAAVTRRFFRRVSRQARLYYAVDAGLAAGFATILATGLVISSWLDLTLDRYAVLSSAHTRAAVLTLALVVVKIGLHWRSIAAVARRGIFRAPGRSAAPGGARRKRTRSRHRSSGSARLPKTHGRRRRALLAGWNAGPWRR
jgi:hypothetical protein